LKRKEPREAYEYLVGEDWDMVNGDFIIRSESTRFDG